MAPGVSRARPAGSLRATRLSLIAGRGLAGGFRRSALSRRDVATCTQRSDQARLSRERRQDARQITATGLRAGPSTSTRITMDKSTTMTLSWTGKVAHRTAFRSRRTIPSPTPVSYTALDHARLLNGALQMGTVVSGLQIGTKRAQSRARQQRQAADRQDPRALSLSALPPSVAGPDFCRNRLFRWPYL